jgi:hypothetical protein
MGFRETAVIHLDSGGVVSPENGWFDICRGGRRLPPVLPPADFAQHRDRVMGETGCRVPPPRGTDTGGIDLGGLFGEVIERDTRAAVDITSSTDAERELVPLRPLGFVGNAGPDGGRHRLPKGRGRW